MADINIQVAARIATNLTPSAVIVCDNSTYTVAFTFDDEWAELTDRVARFTYQRGGRNLYQDQPFEGNTVEVPKLHDIDLVKIGVYAGDIQTTTAAAVLCRRSILGGDPIEDLAAPVRASLQKQIGDLDALDTVEKASLVAAINELAARSGGTLTDEQVAQAVADYLTANPVQAGATAEQAAQIQANKEAIEQLQQSGTPDTGGNAENREDGISPIATVTQTDSGAVISITDKTGTTTATITNGKDGKDGTDGAPGEKGDKGDKGDPGEPGQKGEQGIQGIPGEKGDKGDKGDTGAPGADGAKGDKGDKGDTGATGAQGDPGKDGANGKDGTSATHSWNGTVLTISSASGTSSADLKGAKGDKGDKGDTGAQGIQGEKGDPGASAVSVLNGKKIIYDGDSVCESRTNNGGGYAKVIADIVGGTYNNQAVGGGRIITLKNGESYHSVVDNLENLPTDGDLYCFEGGVNDYWTLGVLGEFDLTDFTGELDESTVCGALESIFRKALTKFVGKPICFVIPHKIQSTAYVENANGNTFKEYRDAMVGICEKYSIPYYDAFSESGLNGWNTVQNKAFLTGNSSGEADGTHPNEEGYKRYYAPQLIQLFERIIPNNAGEITVVIYTNVLETVGYTADKRLSSGNGQMKDNTGTEVTGKISVSAGDVIRFKNVGMPHEGTGIFDNQVAFFGTNDVFIQLVSMDKNVNGATYGIASDGTNVTQFTIPQDINGTTIGSIYICANFDETSIITINEEID